MYRADFTIYRLLARYNRLNEQNLSSLKLTPYTFFWKRSIRISLNTFFNYY